MIVEFFGPPGAGKTTLAHALLCRLRARGLATEVALTYRPGEVAIFDPGGLGSALRRIGRAVIDIIAMVFHPLAQRHAFCITAALVQTLPPKNIIWFVRFGQYILRLSKVWNRSSKSDTIVIFDQAFIQAVCSLAVFNRSANDAAILHALNITPRPDMMIRVKADQGLLENRLRQRIQQETLMERLFEADPNTNLKAGPIVERVNCLLEQHRQAVVAIDVDELASIDHILDEIEQKIITQLQEQTMDECASDPTPPLGERVTIWDSAVQAAFFIPRSIVALVRPQSGTDQAENAENARLTRASIWALLAYVGGAGLTTAVQFLVARLIHAEGYGEYSYVWAWVVLLSYGATLGLTVFVLRFSSAYKAAKQWPLMYGSIRFAVTRSFLAALTVAGIGLLILLLRRDHLEPKFAVSMAIGIATVPLITLHLVGASVVRVFGGFIAAILPERLFRDGLLLVIIGLAAWSAAWPLDARVILAGSFISSGAVLVVVTYAALKRWPKQITGVEPEYLPHEWWAFAFPVTAMMALEIVMTRTGVILLGWSGKIAEAGIFALAYNLAMLIQLPRTAVSIYFSPAASELHSRGNSNGIQSLFAGATVLSLIGSTILALPVLFFTDPILRLFGKDFASDAGIAQALVIGQFIAAAAGPQLTLLTMTGHERSAVVTMMIFAALNIVGCAVAILYYGAMGAAVVTSITLVAWNITMAIQIRRHLGLKPGLIFAITRFWAHSSETITPSDSKPQTQ